MRAWLGGVPLTRVKEQSGFEQTLEELISVIYSRVQFLLPWGLYATDKIVEKEAFWKSLFPRQL